MVDFDKNFDFFIPQQDLYRKIKVNHSETPYNAEDCNEDIRCQSKQW